MAIPMSDLDHDFQISEQTAKTLIGKRIVGLGKLPDKTVAEYGWTHSPWILMLDDGTQVFAQSDDEGNNAGRLNVYNPKLEREYVI